MRRERTSCDHQIHRTIISIYSSDLSDGSKLEKPHAVQMDLFQSTTVDKTME